MLAAGDSDPTKEESKILKKYPLLSFKEAKWNLIECFGAIILHSTDKDCLREEPVKHENKKCEQKTHIQIITVLACLMIFVMN